MLTVFDTVDKLLPYLRKELCILQYIKMNDSVVKGMIGKWNRNSATF